MDKTTGIHGKFMKSKLILWSLLGLSVFLISSCTLIDPVKKLPKTPENIPLESFVPEKATVVLAGFPTDKKQAEQTEKLNNLLYGQYELPFFSLLLSKVFDAKLANHLAILLNREKSMPLLVSFYPDETKESRLGFFAVARLEKPEDFRKQIMLLKAGSVTEGVSENFSIKEQNTDIIFEQKTPAVFGLMKNSYLFFASSPEFFPTAIPATPSKFLQDKTFREYLKKAPKSFSGYFFSKVGQSFFSGNLGLQTIPSFFPKEMASITFISAEENGLRAFAYTKIPRGKEVNPLLSELTKGARVTLMQKIRSDNPVLYLEGHGLINQIRFQKKILLNDPFFAVRRGEKFFQDLEKKIGLSLEQDLAPVLSRNYALLIEDQKKIFPGISLFIDAGGNKEAAKKVFRVIDSGLSALFELFKLRLQTPEQSSQSFFEQNEIDFDGSKAKQIIFYPRRYFDAKKASPEEKGTPPVTPSAPPPPLFGLIDEAWGFTYGLTKENLLFLSTRVEFPQKTLAKHASYQNFASSLSGFNETDHGFFLAAPLVQYGDRLLELAKTNQYLTATQLQGFEIARNILTKFQGLISGNRRKGNWVESQAFIRVGGMAR